MRRAEYFLNWIYTMTCQRSCSDIKWVWAWVRLFIKMWCELFVFEWGMIMATIWMGHLIFEVLKAFGIPWYVCFTCVVQIPERRYYWLVTEPWPTMGFNDYDQRFLVISVTGKRQLTLAWIISTFNGGGIRRISSKSVWYSLASMGYTETHLSSLCC